MFQVTFLGTAGAVPTKTRALASTFVQHGDSRFLIDCPDGTQRQLMQVKGALRGSLHLLITHEHANHLLGIGALVYTLGITRPVERLQVFAPLPASKKIDAQLEILEAKDPLHVALTTITAGAFWEDSWTRCTAFETGHTASSCGFVFEELERRAFLAEEADRIGIPKGEARHRLTAGESVKLPDGRTVHPDMVLGSPKKGAKVAYVADAVPGPHLVAPCLEADCLVAHATFLSRDEDLARRHGHLTVADIARIAQEARVRRLYLTHISSRYDREDVVEEAKMLFPESEVAEDLAQIEIRRADP